MTDSTPRSKPGSTQRLAVVLAGFQGDEHTATDALSSDDPLIRLVALGALERLGTLTRELLERFIADPDPRVRRRVAELAATHPDFDLSPLLRDTDSSVVEIAAWACGEHEAVSDSVLEQLVHLATNDPDPLVREAAVAALGAIGDQRGLPAIMHGCTDKPAIRRRAVLALAPFSGPEVDAAIEAALQDRDWQVRQSAEDIRP